MKQGASLRGPGAFLHVIRRGERFDGKLVRCFVLLEPPGDVTLRVGYSVGRKTGNAVRRNRLRRLLREACRMEQGRLMTRLSEAQRAAALVLQFRTASPEQFERLTVHPVREDLATLCTRICTSLQRTTQ